MKICKLILGILFLNVTSIFAQINKLAGSILLTDSAIKTGHIGICIYEPATNKYWYNYNETKYFVPASNTKLFTLYAGMSILGDSLIGLKYQILDDKIIVQGTGDPTLLHKEFKNQPVVNFLKKINKPIFLDNSNWQDEHLGNGWTWNDFTESYCVSRSALPVYGNLYQFYIEDNQLKSHPLYQQDYVLDTVLKKSNDILLTKNLPKNFTISKSNPFNDIIKIKESHLNFTTTYLPKTVNDNENLMYLTDVVNNTNFGLSVVVKPSIVSKNKFNNYIYSQPTDSLFKPMMHRSDNFYAEQTLMMVSNKFLGFMNTQKIIDTILKIDLKDIPQKPNWVDGSGLSRYNLFTPNDFVFILNKMKNKFGMDRMKTILATGGEGTLLNHYKNEMGFIYAKTGTLSNNCALSGYLYTKSGKMLIFSILNNNYITSAAPIRKAVEKFLETIRNNF